MGCCIVPAPRLMGPSPSPRGEIRWFTPGPTGIRIDGDGEVFEVNRQHQGWSQGVRVGWLMFEKATVKIVDEQKNEVTKRVLIRDCEYFDLDEHQQWSIKQYSGIEVFIGLRITDQNEVPKDDVRPEHEKVEQQIARGEERPLRICPGMEVRIHSLKGTVHLNGNRATCKEWQQDRQRWIVSLDGDPTKEVGVKPENLHIVEGTAVNDQRMVEGSQTDGKSGLPRYSSAKPSSMTGKFHSTRLRIVSVEVRFKTPQDVQSVHSGKLSEPERPAELIPIKLFDLGRTTNGSNIFHQDSYTMEAWHERPLQHSIMNTNFSAPPWVSVHEESETQTREGYVLESDEVERKKEISGQVGMHLEIANWLMGIHGKREELQASSTDKVLRKIAHRLVVGSLSINPDELRYFDLSNDLRKMLESDALSLRKIDSDYFQILEAKFGSSITGKVQIGGLATLTAEETGLDSATSTGLKGEAGLRIHDQGAHIGAENAGKDGAKNKEVQCDLESRPAWSWQLSASAVNADIISGFKKGIPAWEDSVRRRPESIGEVKSARISLAQILLTCLQDLEHLTEDEDCMTRIEEYQRRSIDAKLRKERRLKRGISKEAEERIQAELEESNRVLLQNSADALEHSIAFLKAKVMEDTKSGHLQSSTFIV